MSLVFKTINELVAVHTERFMDDATPATSRQIGFLAAIIQTNGIDLNEIIDTIADYNGGHSWGLDKECAAMLIAGYATPADMKRRADIIEAKRR